MDQLFVRSPSSWGEITIADAAETARRLPWLALAGEIAALLRDPDVTVPPRLVLPLPGGASLFVMPAHDARAVMAKLISHQPANAGTDRPTIQGDVLVFDIATGQRRLLLDGPTVTARRTAAVTLLAARRLAPRPEGPLLIVGAGVQGQAHLQALAAGLPLRAVVVASRSASGAERLAAEARALGLPATTVDDPDAALADCPLVVCCTPARAPVLHRPPRRDAFIAAIGAFTPAMVELAPELVQDIAGRGRVIVDTRDADHEAGDLLQAGIAVDRCPALTDVLDAAIGRGGPVLFKSCGWAGWDLAAARLALRQSGPDAGADAAG